MKKKNTQKKTLSTYHSQQWSPQLQRVIKNAKPGHCFDGSPLQAVCLAVCEF